MQRGFACEMGSSAVSESNTNIGRPETRHNKHGPGRNPTKMRCGMCSVRGVMQTVMFKCVKCNVALCVDRNCFADYQIKNNLQDIFRPSSVQTAEASIIM